MATGQEDIIRLDVAMHHAMRVRVGKRIRDLDEDLHRIVDWELAVSREPVAQRLALDVRHDVIEETACFARVQQRQDVGVLKLGCGLDLPREPIAPERGGQLGAQHFDRDLAMVLDIEGKIDGRHPPRAKLPLDAVAAGQRLRHALESVGHARLTCDRQRECASRRLIRLVQGLVGWGNVSRNLGRNRRHLGVVNQAMTWSQLGREDGNLQCPAVRRSAS